MILKLQQLLFQSLHCKEITDLVSGIYYQVPNDTKFPYIYIGDFISENISTKDQVIYKINFKLILYFRRKEMKIMMQLSELIKMKISRMEEKNSINHLKDIVNLNNDGVTQQIIINFSTIRRREIV